MWSKRLAHRSRLLAQNIAKGVTTDPVPPFRRQGAAVRKNSQRRSPAHSAASASTPAWPSSVSPMYTIPTMWTGSVHLSKPGAAGRTSLSESLLNTPPCDHAAIADTTRADPKRAGRCSCDRRRSARTRRRPRRPSRRGVPLQHPDPPACSRCPAEAVRPDFGHVEQSATSDDTGGGNVLDALFGRPDVSDVVNRKAVIHTVFAARGEDMTQRVDMRDREAVTGHADDVVAACLLR